MFNLRLAFLFTFFISGSAFSREISALPPDTTTNLVDKSAAIYIIEEGKTLFNEGKVRDALVKFREAALKDPNSWKAVYWVGQCHYLMNNYGLALKYAKEALDHDKNDIKDEVYELLGNSYHRTSKVDSAIYYFETLLSSLKVRPGFESGLNMASKDYYKKIEFNLQQAMFAKAELVGGNKSLKVNLGSVNSGYNDYNPILLNGGKTLYFVSRRSDTKGGNMNPDDQEFFEDTYYAVWNDETNDWDSISNELGRINSDGFDAINYISPNGLNGFVTINTTATGAKKTTKGSDLFTIEMSSKAKWSTPRRIASKSINTGFFEGSATMTADGNTMYFVTDRKGNKSSTDIYVAQKAGKSWTSCEPLPFKINTEGRETTPYITPDGRYLFFSSDGHAGMGGLDIFVVENKGGSWGEPVNLGIMVNSVNNDTHFQYYPEMKKAVMSSFEIIGQKASMDMYQVDMSNFVFPQGK
jgi:tetratricopeptide (TPR) repeat protein